jgi:RHS repeat-associated protein
MEREAGSAVPAEGGRAPYSGHLAPAAWPASSFARPPRAWRPGSLAAGVVAAPAAAADSPAPQAAERSAVSGSALAAPATVAGVLTALRAARRERLAATIDLELLSPRAVHHEMELAGLYGLLEGLQQAVPGLRARVWLRSALTASEPFARLPATAVARLPDAAGRAGEAATAAVLTALATSGGVPMLLGPDSGWERRLAALPPGSWSRLKLPRDFQWRLPRGPAVAAATTAFSAALAAATPRWLVAPHLERAAFPPTGAQAAAVPASGAQGTEVSVSSAAAARCGAGPSAASPPKTADHLGTAILASSTAGLTAWSGGLEPFGRDYTTPNALHAGIFLRLPGQIDDLGWDNASLASGFYYNLNRWYEPSIGRYSAPAPMELDYRNVYSYAWDNPLSWSDPLGLSPRRLPRFQRATRLCTPAEEDECRAICGPRGMESCRIWRTFRPVRAKAGMVAWQWVDGQMSCSCHEGPDWLARRCVRNLRQNLMELLQWLADHPPARIPGGGPALPSLPLPVPP